MSQTRTISLDLPCEDGPGNPLLASNAEAVTVRITAALVLAS